MHYHIILTETCNSQCRYCYEKSLNEFNNELEEKFCFDYGAPEKNNVSIKKLKDFLKKDPNPVIIFYGGEPLLEVEKIKEIIDNIQVPFRMQTNGLLLNKIPFNYLNKISKILISLDGDEKRTDYNRGSGTFNKVMENVWLIRKKGYSGELIARMTISSEFPDIFKQVRNLVDLGFDSIHWQIDAGFYSNDFNEKNFKKFVKDYNKNISKLIFWWIDDMKKNKRVLKIYPFIGIIESLLKNEKTLLRCGAGHSGYAITTNGEIVACPIMNSIKDFVAGNLDSSSDNLKKFEIKGECLKCDYLNLCGGRCLYWNKTNLWPKNGNDLICKTIKHLIDELKFSFKEIEKLIESSIIKRQDFDYEKYFGPEIIP